MTDANNDAESLRRGMLGKQFYLIFMRVVEPFDDPRKAFFETHRETFDAHTKWLSDIEKSGVMFASGQRHGDYQSRIPSGSRGDRRERAFPSSRHPN